MAPTRVVCVDVGSTFTKAALVELGSGVLLGTATHRTTGDTDVMDGVDACRAALGAGTEVETLACSSAGGGLRLAVVGYEREVTAEAGQRVGLTAGARVVHVSSGAVSAGGLRDIAASRPDVVLLVGGTDGGNAEVLRHNAEALSASRLTIPTVVAGNVDVRDEVVTLFTERSKPVRATANVLPVIGRLDPRPAREAIRDVFIRHVIGGKGLSRRADFPAMVRAATPDAVLAGVELLADGAAGVEGAGDLLVVDVGGATTDVYSVVTPQGEDATLRKEVVEVLWRSRTVEGDLGMRWNAVGVVDAALGERLLGSDEEARLRPAAQVRAADPAYLPDADEERTVDARLAELAVTVALRRHGRGGKDLREVALVVGSGGVLRHGSVELRERVLRPATNDLTGGWPVPEDANLRKEVVEVLWRSRTVEGDLGMRWNAVGVVDAALGERLLGPDEAARLRPEAQVRAADPAYLPDDDEARTVDARLAELAVTVALRRHGRGGKDLREVAFVVGSGGVLRHGSVELRERVLRPATSDLTGGWPVPENAKTVVDESYVLAAAGLLAAEHPETAARLLVGQLVGQV
ncbi:MAG TPA: glutamate mutase L [Actinomycetes bacterium]